MKVEEFLRSLPMAMAMLESGAGNRSYTLSQQHEWSTIGESVGRVVLREAGTVIATLAEWPHDGEIRKNDIEPNANLPYWKARAILGVLDD